MVFKWKCYYSCWMLRLRWFIFKNFGNSCLTNSLTQLMCWNFMSACINHLNPSNFHLYLWMFFLRNKHTSLFKLNLKWRLRLIRKLMMHKIPNFPFIQKYWGKLFPNWVNRWQFSDSTCCSINTTILTQPAFSSERFK